MHRACRRLRRLPLMAQASSSKTSGCSRMAAARLEPPATRSRSSRIVEWNRPRMLTCRRVEGFEQRDADSEQRRQLADEQRDLPRSGGCRLCGTSAFVERYSLDIAARQARGRGGSSRACRGVSAAIVPRSSRSVATSRALYAKTAMRYSVLRFARGL